MQSTLTTALFNAQFRSTRKETTLLRRRRGRRGRFCCGGLLGGVTARRRREAGVDGWGVGHLGSGVGVCELAFWDGGVSVELAVGIWGGLPSSLMRSFSIWFSRVRFCVSAW